MIAYWIAFAGFFFGLTYGLLQICTELPIVRRERFVGVGLGPYLLSKLAVLLPLLLAVDVVMLGALRAFDRLPALDGDVALTLVVALLAESAAALALGLLTSAAVADAAQATIALPMLCFPAVLFSGVIVPVPEMAAVGRAIAAVTPARWAFEAVGRALDLGALRSPDGSPSSEVLAGYGDAFAGGVARPVVVLVGFTAAFLAAAVLVLERRCRPSAGRHRS
jgi:hypothetical protein